MVFIVDVLQGVLEVESSKMKLSIIIPAHNEQNRVGKTLDAYHDFFEKKQKDLRAFSYEIVVVLNGCTDDTLSVVKQRSDEWFEIRIIDIPEAGKGLAVKVGFEDALKRKNDLIGFVDADMATQPQYFYALLETIGDADGVIADRYMPGATIFPPRPPIKEWGRRLVYHPLVWLLFGLNFYDNQCGAKLFKRRVIEVVVPLLTVSQWAFDVELLYLCKKNGFTIKAVPTVWYDQDESNFKPFRQHRMLTALVKARWRHSRIGKLFEKV